MVLRTVEGACLSRRASPRKELTFFDQGGIRLVPRFIVLIILIIKMAIRKWNQMTMIVTP